MSFLKSALRASLEDDTSGSVMTEREYAVYAKISDFSVLDSADEKQHIEQANFYSENKGKGSLSFRSRKITYMLSKGRQDVTEFIFTTKTPNAGTAGQAEMQEVSVPGSAEQHALYMQYGHHPIIKDRFIFNVPGLEKGWDVDLFILEGGGYSPWCRMELEVSQFKGGVPDLPFDVADSFSADDKERRDSLKQTGEIAQ